MILLSFAGSATDTFTAALVAVSTRSGESVDEREVEAQRRELQRAQGVTGAPFARGYAA